MEQGDKSTDIYYKLGEMHGDIKSTLAEAKRTNGRVTKLESETIPKIEKDINTIKVKIAFYSGIAAVIVFVAREVLSKLLS